MKTDDKNESIRLLSSAIRCAQAKDYDGLFDLSEKGEALFRSVAASFPHPWYWPFTPKEAKVTYIHTWCVLDCRVDEPNHDWLMYDRTEACWISDVGEVLNSLKGNVSSEDVTMAGVC